MSDTITAKHIDHASIVPDMRGEGLYIEILARRRLHGKPILIKIPFKGFTDGVLSAVCRQAAGELKTAQGRVNALNGCFVLETLKN